VFSSGFTLSAELQKLEFFFGVNFVSLGDIVAAFALGAD
jgi:hypothetical protein